MSESRRTAWVVGTFDTKGDELHYLCERIRAQGVAVISVDVSTSHIEQQLPRLIEERQVVKVATGHYHAVGYEEKCERPGCGG